MKQIFDWLRWQTEEHLNHCKQMAEQSRYFSEEIGYCSRADAYEIALELINEAEAKWEEDCCIRVVGKPFTSSCGQKYDKWTYVGEPYCAKCGKPIKISEVE